MVKQSAIYLILVPLRKQVHKNDKGLLPKQ